MPRQVECSGQSVRHGKIWLITISLVIAAMSCHTVKPYQRAYLNDEAMQTGKRSVEKLSSNVHNYREGASGGGRAKAGGGCGCN